MKTRAQIYSHEASGILRDIFTYGVLHRNRFWVYIHRRMSNALCAMNTMDLQRYPENYELLSTDAALRAEQIACRMRHLVYGFTTVQKHEYLTSAANVLGITITAHPGLVEITLPGLLPKNGLRGLRLTTSAKRLLLQKYPIDLVPYPTGASEANSLKSEPERRMRLHRFCCALTLHNQTGGILCFDYQADTLQEVFGAQVNITSIDFAAYERMMLHQ